MKKSNILPEIRFDDNKPLKVDICNLKLSAKDKIIIKEVAKRINVK